MRKRIIADVQQKATSTTDDWLNIEDLADVEITSENIDYPIEFALLPGRSTGWRAATPGKQTIRLVFSPSATTPTHLDSIQGGQY